MRYNDVINKYIREELTHLKDNSKTVRKSLLKKFFENITILITLFSSYYDCYCHDRNNYGDYPYDENYHIHRQTRTKR